jgi:hypothetical protein
VYLDDRRLARRLDREARAAERIHARAIRAHARAVARQERLVRCARERLPKQAVIAAGALTGAVVWDVEPLYVVAAIFGLRAVGSVLRLTRPAAPPPPPALPVPAVPPPPPVNSVAFSAVRRLEQARLSLVRLVPLVAPAGREAADEAWRAAGEADLALRWQAARLAAVEPHRGAEPALVDQLFSGVVAQERLVAGMADLVSASADPLATMRLQDATDALHGLAQGLREVR